MMDKHNQIQSKQENNFNPDIKFIVLSGLAVRKKEIDNLGYYILPKYGEYELWDIAPFFKEKWQNKEISFHDEIEEIDYLVKIESFQALQNKIKSLKRFNKKCFIFPFYLTENFQIKLIKICSELKIPYIIKETKDHPVNSLFENQINIISIKNVFNNILKSIKFYRKNTPPLLSVLPTKTYATKLQFSGYFQKKLYIHNNNYDKCLNLISDKENNNKINLKNYVVYIDQNLPLEPQFLKKNPKPFLQEKDFWDRMELFFNIVLSQTKSEKIVICSHPNRSSDSKSFLQEKGFIVTQYDTALYVKHSSLVILHCSTSVDFAVIYNKPVCFIAMSEMKEINFFLTRTEQYANLLNRKINFIEKGKVPTSINMGVDNLQYKKFLQKWIKTPGTPDINSWEYIASYLGNNYKR